MRRGAISELWSRRAALLALMAGCAWLAPGVSSGVAKAESGLTAELTGELPASSAVPQRVVSLGGGVTEIVYALGAADRLVAVDDSSVYPSATAELPKVGYYRTTPVEGVVGFRPDLVLASSQAGPEDALERIAGLGVRVVTVPDQPTLASLEQRIREVGMALGVPDAGEQLASDVRRRVEKMSDQSSPWPEARALFLMNRGGRWLAAGQGTAANATLELAGIGNAFSEFDGYKEISAESLVALAPDLVVTTTLSVEGAGGRRALAQLPGLSTTPAGRHDRMIVLDDLLALGFGPRLPQAVTALREGVADVAQR